MRRHWPSSSLGLVTSTIFNFLEAIVELDILLIQCTFVEGICLTFIVSRRFIAVLCRRVCNRLAYDLAYELVSLGMVGPLEDTVTFCATFISVSSSFVLLSCLLDVVLWGITAVETSRKDQGDIQGYGWYVW